MLRPAGRHAIGSSHHARPHRGIARVVEEQAERERQLSELRTRLAEWNEPIPRSAALSASATMRPDTKVELFLSLFRGRADVYPTRFVRKRDGQAGYAPDCRNKFVKGVCDLPKVKCGECANQAFRPFDAAAVREHLLGKHVMGVYPLLEMPLSWVIGELAPARSVDPAFTPLPSWVRADTERTGPANTIRANKP